MVRIEVRRGPLTETELGWVGHLYGQADRKYADPQFLRHQFVANPCGWALHAFAFSNESVVPVGHCAVIPIPVRHNGASALSGKVEAFFLEEGVRSSEVHENGSVEPVALAILTRLYAEAERQGIAMLHAVANEHLGVLHRMAGCRRVPIPGSLYYSLGRYRSSAASPATEASRHLLAVVARVQKYVRVGGGLGMRTLVRTWAEPSARPPTDADLALFGPVEVARGWTIVASDMWPWVRKTGFFRVLEWPGSRRIAALVREGQEEQEFDQLVAWRPSRGGMLEAGLCLDGVCRYAERRRRAGVRVHIWPGLVEAAAMRRATRLLGFLTRPRGLGMYVRSPNPEAWQGDQLIGTPLFYLTF